MFASTYQSRFSPVNGYAGGVLSVDQLRRAADTGADVWTVFNRIQENVIKGGLYGTAKDAHGRTVHRKTREVKGIDQNDTLNRALWRLSVEVAKLAA